MFFYLYILIIRFHVSNIVFQGEGEYFIRKRYSDRRILQRSRSYSVR